MSVSIFHSAHATFLSSLRETSAAFHNQVSPKLPRIANLAGRLLCCISELCAQPRRASFLPSVRLNSLMVIIIISICCCSQLPLDLQALVLKAKTRKVILGIHFLSRGSFCGQKSDCQMHSGADLHTKQELEPGSHVRQLLHQQNSVL